MLDGMRRASQGLVGRLVLGLIMGVISLSFAIWGIGDIFRNFSAGAVAAVGSSDISAEVFRQSYQTQLQNIQQRAKRAVTNDEARALGLDRQVLNRLIAEAALDQRVHSLGLALSDEAIVRATMADPTFADPATSRFDPQRFQAILRDSGFSEKSFMREQRAVYLRQDLADALAGEVEPPREAVEAMHRYAAETRSIDYFELPLEAADAAPAPGDDELRAYFAARAQSFQAPERRAIVALALDPGALADAAAVSDADARLIYDQSKAERFGEPERRTLRQVVFANEADAAAARAKIEAGSDLAAVAAQSKLDVVDLGAMTRKQVLEPAVAAAAFALPEGGVSQPVATQFGSALVQAAAIEPERARPFEEVVATLKSEIARERARATIAQLHDRIEDERTSGKTLAEAAKTVGLEAAALPAVDAQGRDAAGSTPALPARDALLKAAFASDVGVDNDLLTTPGGGYVWFEVADVQRGRGRSFEEARAEVEKQWRADQTARRLTQAGDALARKIDAGATIEDVAKEAGGLALKHADVKRVGASPAPPGVAARVFALPVGRAGSAAGENGETRVVFKSLGAATPPLDPDGPQAKGFAETLKTSMANDLLDQYVAKLKDDAGVVINEGAARAAIGPTSAY